MPYVSIPPTVSKVQAANRSQRIYLQQCQTTLTNYSKWCPHLADHFKLLQYVIRELISSLEQQDALIQQRIQLQATLNSTGLARSAGLVSTIPNPLRIPDYICIPSLEVNKTDQRIPSAIGSQDRFFPVPALQTIINNPVDNDSNCFARPRREGDGSSLRDPIHCDDKILVQEERSECTPTRSCSTVHDSSLWSRIPTHLRAFPSVFEQLTKSRSPTIPVTGWTNRFSPLFEEYYDECNAIMAGLSASQESHGTVLDPSPPSPSQDLNMIERQATPHEAPNSQEECVDLDALRQLIDVPLLDSSLLKESTSSYAEVVQLAPKSVHKIRFECHISKFPKNTPKTERILHVFEVARRFDKSACLYPSGKEAHAPLSSLNEIKNARIHRYFQDKPGAQSQRYANSLYGFIVFGITGDVDDFELAMKDWAISQRHDLLRQGVSSNSLIAGFLTQCSLTISRDDCVQAIKATPQWKGAGCPDFSVKFSMLWGTGGSAAKVPALCLECDRTKVDPFVKMCEALFFGDNASLPSMLREVLFFPSRSFAPNNPVCLTYITSQHDFISSERTVTCEGIGNIYQHVRLQCDPTKKASIEDILMRLTGSMGPLFRSLDRTLDNKVFLKLDVTNLDAWRVRSSELVVFLQRTVHPDDHPVVFNTSSMDIAYSDPWAKFVNGKMARNVLDIPSKASIDFVGRCAERLTTPQLGGLKKRAHASVSCGSTATTAVSSTASLRSSISGPAIDLTEDTKPSASPSHKVHVVEQRPFQSTSPISSIDGSAATSTGPSSPNTARMQKLEAKVADHDTKLGEIQRTVTSLDDKIGSQHAETTFNFNKFASMLNMINENIMAGVAATTSAQAAADSDVPAEMMDEYQEYLAGEGAYNPIAEHSKWNELWRRDHAHRAFIDSQRTEYVDALRRDAEHYGESFDYWNAARERFPSPPPIDYPDDITFVDP